VARTPHLMGRAAGGHPPVGVTGRRAGPAVPGYLVPEPAVPPGLPPPYRIAATVAVVAVIVVGCHPTPPEAADDPTRVTGALSSAAASTGRSPVAYAAGGLDPFNGPGGTDGPGDPSLAAPPVDDESGPEVVAARLVADRLADEGLETVWVDTRLLETTQSGAIVEVQVAHSAGSGHPTQSGYQLTLVAEDGGWRVERFVEAG
jgi:hypothetical protein